MKFPSVKYLATQATATFSRFYLPMLFSITGAIMAVLLIENNSAEIYARLICTCTLGLSLSLGCTLYAERSGKPYMRIVAVVLPLLFAAAYFYWLAPGELFRDFTVTLIYFVLAVVMHLFVAVAPYLGHNEPTGFWRFNETLFARMLLSVVFSGTLFVGLVVAIAACDNLFKIHIDNKVYPELWMLTAGIFNTWFFLTGIPADYTTLNTEKVYPKFLKIFTQYILIPLVVLYMCILYAYGLKIVIAWDLPKGFVSSLIMAYAVAGILAVLLVTPLRDDKDTPWVRFFSRFFFIATLPLIVLLYVAIMTRVNDYGITESRYFLLLIGAWLGGISLYFIFSSRKNIKVVPISLAILGLVSLAGPWSAFSVSERSQVHRLQAILIKNKVWAPGEKIAATPGNIPEADADEINSIVQYMIEREKTKALQPFVSANIDTIIAASYYTRTEDSVDTNPTYNWRVKDNLKEKLMPMFCANCLYGALATHHDNYYRMDVQQGMDLTGYTRSFDMSLEENVTTGGRMELPGGDVIIVNLSKKDTIINIEFSRNDTNIETVPLNALIRNLATHSSADREITLPQKEMTLDGTGTLRPRIIIRSTHLTKIKPEEDFDGIYSLDVTVLLR